MGLKQAFNLITRLHSRAATLKRFGSPDIYSPIRITPSNFFRYLEGPGNTVIHGREFIIPVDSMKGHVTQLITFGELPTQGAFLLTYGVTDTAEINFDDNAAAVQVALRAITGLEDITVSGNFTDGFLVTFIGLDEPTLLASELGATPLADADDEEVEITVAVSTSVPWSPLVKRGDKIDDSVYGSIAIDEIVEMVDFGGAVMGFRVRCE